MIFNKKPLFLNLIFIAILTLIILIFKAQILVISQPKNQSSKIILANQTQKNSLIGVCSSQTYNFTVVAESKTKYQIDSSYNTSEDLVATQQEIKIVDLTYFKEYKNKNPNTRISTFCTDLDKNYPTLWQGFVDLKPAQAQTITVKGSLEDNGEDPFFKNQFNPNFEYKSLEISFGKDQLIKKIESTEVDDKKIESKETKDKKASLIFKDVGKDNIFLEHIQELLEDGIVEGYEDGNFGILNKLSRGEMAKLIQKSLDIPVDISCGGFKDLKPDQDFYKEAISLKCAGIASGYGDGTFGKDRPISREESLKFIIKGLEYKGLEFEIPQTESLPFLDIKDSVFKEFILKAFYAQIVDGYQDKTFKPKAYIVRQEMAKIINLARKS